MMGMSLTEILGVIAIGVLTWVRDTLTRMRSMWRLTC